MHSKCVAGIVSGGLSTKLWCRLRNLHLVLSPAACTGKQRNEDTLPELVRHRDRLACSLREFEAASDSVVLVGSSDFESYSDYLQQLQQVKVITFLHWGVFHVDMRGL